MAKWLELVAAGERELVERMAADIGKPVRVGRQELSAAAGFVDELTRQPPAWLCLKERISARRRWADFVSLHECPGCP